MSGLYNSLFMSESIGLMLVNCASGVALDVNERLLTGGLCTREAIVGRQVEPTYDAVLHTEDWDSQPPSLLTNEQSLPAATGALVGSTSMSQYGVINQSVLALYRRQVDQISIMWRAQLGCGWAHDVPLSGFVTSRDDAAESRPRMVLVTLSSSEAKRMEHDCSLVIHTLYRGWGVETSTTSRPQCRQNVIGHQSGIDLCTLL